MGVLKVEATLRVIAGVPRGDLVRRQFPQRLSRRRRGCQVNSLTGDSHDL